MLYRLTDIIQLVCTKYGHYMIVLTIVIYVYVCSRILIPQNPTITCRAPNYDLTIYYLYKSSYSGIHTVGS